MDIYKHKLHNKLFIHSERTLSEEFFFDQTEPLFIFTVVNQSLPFP